MQKLSWISKKKVARKYATIAKKEHQRAKNLLRVHYPSLKEPKVLMQAIQAMHTTAMNMMLARLAVKGWLVESKNSTVILQEYMKYCSRGEECNLFVWLASLIRAYKESPLCFKRNEVYVVCNDSLETVIVSQKKVEEKMGKLLKFMEKK